MFKLFAVYPRWRGEHRDHKDATDLAVGLSPLARGTLRRLICAGPLLRFIPAGAGNTAEAYPTPGLVSVYPRWRGEHTRNPFRLPLVIGLSPLARGTPVECKAGTESNRFIPAGAGNTFILNMYYWYFTVYPRWRGEHIVVRIEIRVDGGLSPLARGTPQWRASSQCQRSVYPRWRGEHLSRC